MCSLVKMQIINVQLQELYGSIPLAKVLSESEPIKTRLKVAYEPLQTLLPVSPFASRLIMSLILTVCVCGGKLWQALVALHAAIDS